MSIINAIVTPESALVVSDTEIVARYENGSTVGHTTKALALPHMPAIIAARGRLLATAAICGLGLYCSDLDALDDNLATLAAGMLEHVATVPEAAGDPELHKIEIFLVGWSARAGRIRASHIAQEAEGAGFVRSPPMDELLHVSPWPEEWGPAPPAPQSRAEHVALARRQAAALKAMGEAGGGDLIFAELDRSGVSYEIVHDFMRGADAPRPDDFGAAMRGLGSGRIGRGLP